MKTLSISKWKWVYRCLAILNFMAIGSSLTVNHLFGLQYEQTVVVNEYLADRLRSLESLLSLASAVNEPGNDVFSSKNVPLELTRFRQAKADFDSAYIRILQSLVSRGKEIPLEIALKHYAEIPSKMEDMERDAEALFRQFRSGEISGAGASMSAMDRRHGDLRQAILHCSQALRDLESEIFKKERAAGERLRRFAWILSLVIFLLIGGVLAYGRAVAVLIDQFLQEKTMATEHKKVLDEAAIVAITDTAGKITYVNDKFVEISGYERPELMGRDHRIINSAYHPKSFFSNLWSTISSGRVWRGEVKNRRKNGTFYWVDSVIVPMKNEVGKTFQYMAIRYEITERKALEENLVRAREEAIAASKAKASFLANMSHEIRTPLNGMLGMTALLGDERLSTDGKRFLGILKNSGEILLALINDILDFSKIEAGRLVLERVSFSPEDVVHELVSLLYFRAKEKGLTLHVDVDPTVPKYISADVTRFRQVVTNLVGNAIKFTQTGSVSIFVTSTPETPTSGNKCTVRVDVVDTGIGMAPEAQLSLFQSFSQVDASTTRKYGGTGLGLAICKGICEAMGGRIWVESSVGQGATFSFTIAAEKSELSAPTPVVSEVGTKSDMALHLPLSILVADDNSTNQLLARKYLEKLGYAPDVVGNGLEVLNAMKESRYDVIFMDGHMPEMDGYEVTKRIHARLGREKSPRIIAFTASVSADDRQRCLEAGMDDFVPKPFTLTMMAQALQRICGGKVDANEGGQMSTANGKTDSKQLDTDAILKHFAGDDDIMKEVIAEFLTSSPGLITKIQTAIQQKRARDLVVAAHTLKGMVSNFFAKDLRQVLAELESLGGREHFSDAGEKLAEARTMLTSLNTSLQSLLDQKKAA